MLISLSSMPPHHPRPPPSLPPRCRMHYCFVFVFFFVYCEEWRLPHSNCTQPGGSLGATVQIRARLATACNLLKFNVIFRSPMGTPFACRTAVTNRCNLLIMCPRYALLHGHFRSHGGWLWRAAAAAVAAAGMEVVGVLELLRAAEEAPPHQQEAPPCLVLSCLVKGPIQEKEKKSQQTE